MKLFLLILFGVVLGSSANAQHHYSNWIHRNASDTTVVVCWNDSLTQMFFPPGSMGMMGMMGMMYDSVYSRIDNMPMDSLHHPHDSTVIGWYRMLMGRDSSTFDLMHDQDGHGNHHMMQYMNTVHCQVHWDSMRADSVHRHWRPTGLMGWDGTSWETIPATFLGDNILVSESMSMYSATAIIGSPGQITSVPEGEVPGRFSLEQNYPNPFNPSTIIEFSLPEAGFVTLTVHNLIGQELATIVSGERAAGTFRATWDAGGFSSGVYFYRLTAGNYVQTKKMVMLQ
ncbi:MAG: T9SS type A sorting domain-containing protein [Bacteroidota bacterium]